MLITQTMLTIVGTLKTIIYMLFSHLNLILMALNLYNLCYSTGLFPWIYCISEHAQPHGSNQNRLVYLKKKQVLFVYFS